VEATSRELGNQRYHLELAPAGPDDTSPGLFWGNGARRGTLHGDGIDVIDLYNWDLQRAAIVELKLAARAEFDVILYNSRGRFVACGCEEGGDESMRRRLRPGQYFVAVRASAGAKGKYKLSRVVRTITHTRTTINGGGGAKAAPGQSVTIRASVSPTVSGKVVITLQRHDPIFGWQFVRTYTGSVGGGSLAVSFTPPGVGRWRAFSSFQGTRTANPSDSKTAYLRVSRQ
jgi:hypothetical protein